MEVTGVVVPAGCSATGNTVLCSTGSLASGASTAVILTGTVLPSARGPLSVMASVTGVDADPVAGNNTAMFASGVAAQADLLLAHTASPEPVIAGTLLTSTLSVTNAGPSQATGVQLTTTLPAALVLSTVTPGAPTCTASGNTVACALPDLAPGTSTQVMVDGTVLSTATGPVSALASVTSAVADPDPQSNTATAMTTVTSEVDLSLSLTVIPDPVVVGTMLTYTLTLANAGPSQAADVTVTSILSAPISFVASASSPGCTEAPAGTVTCSVEGLAPGTRLAVTLVVMPDVLGSVSNTAQVASASPDPTPANDRVTAVSTVIPFLGDVNADSAVDSDDARLILEILVGLQPPPAHLVAVADVDHNGVVTNLDAVLILAAQTGLIPLSESRIAGSP